MAFDGLNIDYQGVEGHGAAQIFGPNKNIDILQDHLKTVAADLAKKRAAIADNKLDLDEKALGTVWERDIPEIAQGKNEIMNGYAEFYKKYNANPNMVGTPQYIEDQVKLKKAQSDLMLRAQQSAQAKTAYNEHANEYAKHPNDYRPETEAELAKILAIEGEDKWNGKRSDLLNRNPYVYNVDEPQFIKDVTGAIGSNIVQTDDGVTKNTKKNIIFDDKGNPTEWGRTVALPQAQVAVNSQKGKRIIANMKRDNPGLTDEEAATQLTAKILHGIDTENRKDVNLPPKEKEDASKPKVNGDTVAYGNNVWTRRLLDDGTETFTMTKKDAAYNKPIPFTATDGSVVVGIPQSMTRNPDKGAKSFIINVVTQDENGSPLVKKVYYESGNNADLIKGEYGADPFKVRGDVTGTLEIGKAGVGSVSNKGVATPPKGVNKKEVKRFKNSDGSKIKILYSDGTEEIINAK